MLPKQIRCPQCATLIEYRVDNPFSPFCGERCKLIDLGAWAQERYAIPGPATVAGEAMNETEEVGLADSPLKRLHS